MTLRALLRNTRDLLGSVTEEAEFEARCLVEHFCGLSFSAILAHGGEAAGAKAEEAVREAVERRKSGEPLQYILGSWEFMGLTLRCGPGVLIPREDTEAVVRAAAAALQGVQEPCGLDLCAGTGAIALSLVQETGAKVTAVELFDAAFSYLTENIKKHPALAVTALQGDALSAEFAGALPEGLDFIISNPPYIETGELPALQKEVQAEPKTALDGGADGLVFYRALCGIWAKKIRPGGVLAVEIGETQAEAVSALFRGAGLENIRVYQDAAGLDRAVLGRLPKTGDEE